MSSCLTMLEVDWLLENLSMSLYVNNMILPCLSIQARPSVKCPQLTLLPATTGLVAVTHRASTASLWSAQYLRLKGVLILLEYSSMRVSSLRARVPTGTRVRMCTDRRTTHCCATRIAVSPKIPCVCRLLVTRHGCCRRTLRTGTSKTHFLGYIPTVAQMQQTYRALIRTNP